MGIRHSIALALVAVALGACSKQPAPAPVAADPLLKKIESGELRGIAESNGSHAWLGIPYAKPPVGALRWQAPQPIDPWQGVLAADRDEHVCPQFVREQRQDPSHAPVVLIHELLHTLGLGENPVGPGRGRPGGRWR